MHQAGGNPEVEAPTPSAAEKVALWNRELLKELLPIQNEPNVPVVLACDDETLRAVGERLGYETTEAATAFAQQVKIAFDVGRVNGFKYAVREQFEKLPRPRPLPQFFALLCLWVLAASRMGADEKYPTSEYYGRLNSVLEMGGHDQLPCFEFIRVLFERFGSWLADDLRGERGRLIVPDDPYPPWVGLAVSQTVFRARDRQVLSQFFSERLRTLDGFDPLRRLRRWSGRHQLTNHALRLLDEEPAEGRVRSSMPARLVTSATASGDVASKSRKHVSSSGTKIDRRNWTTAPSLVVSSAATRVRTTASCSPSSAPAFGR